LEVAAHDVGDHVAAAQIADAGRDLSMAAACAGSRELPAPAHTSLDARMLELYGVDPSSKQPRERAVPCRSEACDKQTWHLGGGCAIHYRLPVQTDGLVGVAR
jgi:hypothetical protein